MFPIIPFIIPAFHFLGIWIITLIQWPGIMWML